MTHQRQTAAPQPFPPHINRGTNVRYLARVRPRGHRLWTPLTKWIRCRRRAALLLAGAMEANSTWRRGQLLHMADWYDPTIVMEITR